MNGDRNHLENRMLTGLLLQILPLALFFNMLGTSWAGGELGFFSLPEGIEVKGCQVFDNSEVRQALAEDSMVIAKARPGVSIDEFAHVLKERLLEGLSYCGFISAKVDLLLPRQGSHKFSLLVHEGERARAAEISVRGSQAISKEVLRQEALSAVKRLSSSPGASAFLRLSESERSEVEGAIEEIYASQGYLFADSSISVEAKDGDKALIELKIEEEGPCCRFHSIEIKGDFRESEKAIEDYLSIEEGRILTGAFLDELRERLYLSGRFLESELDVLPPEGDRSHCLLVLNVREYEDGPLLSQELSQEEKDFLALRDWFIKDHCGGRDFLFQLEAASGFDLSGALSFERGLLLTSRKGSSEASLLWTPKELSVFRAGAKELWSIPLSRGLVSLRLHVLPNPDAEEADGSFKLNLGLDFKSDDVPQKQSALGLNLKIAPVALLSLPGREGLKSRIEDGRRIIEYKKGDERFEAVIDRETSALISIGGGVGIPLEISSSKGGFEVLEGVFERKSRESKDLSGLKTSLRFFYEVFEDFYDEGSEELRREFWRGAVDPFVSELSKSLPSFSREAKERSEGKFSIPSGTAPKGLMAKVSGALKPVILAQGYLPPLAWPRLLSKGLYFILRGEPQYVGPYLERIARSPRVGAASYYLISMLMKTLNPRVSRNFALRARQELKRSGIDKDLDFLLGIPFTARIVDVLLRSLSTVDAKSLEEALEGFSAQDKEKIMGLFGKFREKDVKSCLEELSPLLIKSLDARLPRLPSPRRR